MIYIIHYSLINWYVVIKDQNQSHLKYKNLTGKVLELSISYTNYNTVTRNSYTFILTHIDTHHFL